MKLGDLIKQYRSKNKLTMQDFANSSGLSKGYISMLEKNQHPQSQRKLSPSLETYQKVAYAMSLSLDDLIAMLDGDEVVHFSQGNIELSDSESYLLSIYRSLNEDGQDKVTEYASDLSASKRYQHLSLVKEEDIEFNAIAAHERTDIEVTDEMRKHDDDIMKDENF